MFSLLKMTIVLTIISAVGGYVWHCESVKKDSAAFIGRLEEQAEAQRLRVVAKITKDKINKERTDAKNKKDLNDQRTINKRLRDQRASADFLPSPAPASKSPDEATIIRPEFERAIRKFDQGVQGLIDEGDEARIDLNSAKAWAKE